MNQNTNHQRIPLSVRQSFSDKTVFVIGTTGFLGKVWLTQLLSQVQTFKKIYILIRKNGSASSVERFEQLINTSYVFEHLHQKFHNELSGYLNDKVEVLEGDVSIPNFGLDEEQVQKLASEVDITINFAGLVDFNPDLREAFSVNILGAIHAADFARQCRSKKLVHISTCYVAGSKQGPIEETIVTDRSPSGKPLSIEDELQWIETEVEKILVNFESPEQLVELRKMIEERNVELDKAPFTEKKLAKTMDNMKRKKLHEALTLLGMNHARELGWTNTYTYTKSLAEIILKQQYADLELVVFRPSIVESSFAFPFAGWNEGFNTSGPLAYLMKTWFRHLPLKKGNPFDIIPVDYVARGLSIASAALLSDVHREVYQCASSEKNRLTIDEACRLTADSHSVYYKEHGDGFRERQILSRWKTIPSRKDHPLSIPNLKRVSSFFQKIFFNLSKIPVVGGMFKSTYRWLLKITRRMEQIEKLLELFYPFIHDYRHIFLTHSLYLYDVKEDEFAFTLEQIDWQAYWLDTQMPGLRKWCFPVIEGRGIEKFTPTYPVKLTIPYHAINGSHKPMKETSDKMAIIHEAKKNETLGSVKKAVE